ncbi:DUF3331 domain-containing protein [Paraburkholderia sp. JHI869]|uniref:DUF3331 domain-containing protein n=1 Tax=Paraburkholderia sp. JHI869 TaxID=3112959 RepID=UPI00317C2D4F
MTALSEEDIVTRTLLNVLDPSDEQLNAGAKKQVVALKNRRITVCSPVAGADQSLAKRPYNIMVVAQLSSYSISVSWSDPCVGRYTEQIWCSACARVAAICALTGRAINRGDRVFLPRKRRGLRAPPNFHQMILAEAITDSTDLAIAGT